jgi:hypothetical protein
VSDVSKPPIALKVVPISTQQPPLEALPNAIRAEIDKYAGQLSLAEAVGVLEIVKLELIKEHS